MQQPDPVPEVVRDVIEQKCKDIALPKPAVPETTLRWVRKLAGNRDYL